MSYMSYMSYRIPLSNPPVFRRFGTEPAFRHDFLACVERDRVLAVRPEVAEDRLLPAAEREERHRRRHAEVNPEHARLDAFAELAARRSRLGEQRHRVAVAAAIRHRDRLVQVAGAQHADD